MSKADINFSQKVLDGGIGEEYVDNLSNLQTEIKKKYGYNLDTIDSILDEKKKVISISPLFDMHLQGGIPEGSTVLLSGPPKCGKTTLALQIALGGQELDGRPTFYFDIEGRFKVMNLSTVKGLNPKLVTLIRSKKDDIISGDKHLNMAYDIIKSVPGAIIILDSTSQVVSSGELEEDITNNIRSAGPKMMSFFTKKISSIMCCTNAIVIMIQHVIADTGRSRKTKMTSGGTKIQYQGDINLECSYDQDWMNGDELIGKVSHWRVLTSAMGKPSVEFPANIRYGVGLDKVQEMIDFGVDFGYIEKAGKSGWHTLSYLLDLISVDDDVTAFAVENGIKLDKLETKVQKEKLERLFKFNGAGNVRKFMEENDFACEKLKKIVSDTLK